MINIAWIKSKVLSSEYEISDHAEIERQADKISINEIEQALITGEIIENYPDDLRGPSCLVLGFGNERFPLHIVCGKTRKLGLLRIITVYIPTLPKWIDFKTRRQLA